MYPIYFASASPFWTAYVQSDLFGKAVMLGLVFLSVVCWAILAHKTWITKHVRSVSKAFQLSFEQNKEQLFHLDINQMPKPKNSFIPNPYAHIFKELKTKTLEILDKNHFFAQKKGEDQVYLSAHDVEVLETHALTIISIERKSLEKNLFVLATIVTLGPFLGLLGTVWGILVTFAELHSGGAIGSNAAVLGGISTALATTVLGLLIAIPALVFYNYLKNTLTHYTSDMEDFSYGLLSCVELQYRKTE